MLDLGAGAALVRRASRRDDLVWWAVDADVACAAALGRWSEHAAIARLEGLRFEAASGRFEAIVLADVLEHLSSPEEMLRRVAPVLAPDGRLLISVPNVAHLWMRLNLLLGRFDYAERGILDRDHLRFFTRRSLVALLRRSGFVVRRTATSGVPLDRVASGWIGGVLRVFSPVQGVARRVWPEGLGYQWLVESQRESTRAGDP